MTTLDDSGLPQTRTMFSQRRREQLPGLEELFLGHEMAHMRRNAAVAVYYCDPATCRGVQLSGGMEDPDYSVLRLAPERASGWKRNQAFGFKVRAAQ